MSPVKPISASVDSLPKSNLATIAQGYGWPLRSGPLDIGKLIHPNFNGFCVGANKYLLPVAKSLWGLYFPLQIVGLINEKVEKLARAWYGVFWSLVYSGYRPWAMNRRTLEGDKASTTIKNLYSANEHFRVIMGSIVSAIYGGGALGMLWGWLKGDDDFYDKAFEVYRTGMFNQNQIFSSMNATITLRRKYNQVQLNPVDKEENDIKAKVELVDSVLFIPQIITRLLDTFKLFGLGLSEGMQRLVNGLAYFGYGTWAARYGFMKNSEESGGDLQKVRSKTLRGATLKTDKLLHGTQKVGSNLFYTILPALSWASAIAEFCGFRELAEIIFKLEGKCERLDPMIASWAIRHTWFDWLTKPKKARITPIEAVLESRGRACFVLVPKDRHGEMPKQIKLFENKNTSDRFVSGMANIQSEQLNLIGLPVKKDVDFEIKVEGETDKKIILYNGGTNLDIKVKNTWGNTITGRLIELLPGYEIELPDGQILILKVKSTYGIKELISLNQYYDDFNRSYAQ